MPTPRPWTKDHCVAVGDYCRAHKDTGELEPPEQLLGCSGEGRPTCKATECMFGAEPCPNGNHWKGEGLTCNFCPRPKVGG